MLATMPVPFSVTTPEAGHAQNVTAHWTTSRGAPIGAARGTASPPTWKGESTVKRLAFVGGCIALGAGAWGVASVMSSDAIGMIIGLLFGILAGVPPALLVLVAARRNAERDPFRQPPPTVYRPAPPPAALLPGPVTLVFEDAQGRRATMQFADPDAARRFLAEGRR